MGELKARTKNTVSFLEVKEDNYFECLEFITKSSCSIEQLSVPFHKKEDEFKKDGIYFKNDKGEFTWARKGMIMVKDYHKIKVLDKIHFNLFYEVV